MTQRTWHTAPARETLTRIPASQLARFHREVASALAQLPLEVYLEGTDTYWFGIKGEGFSEHHRWLCVIQPDPTPKEQPFFRESVNGVPKEYYRGIYSDVVQCGTALRRPNNAGSQPDAFEHLVKELNAIALELEDTLDLDGLVDDDIISESEANERRHKALIMFQSFGFLGMGHFDEMMKLPWDQDMHDLIHHPGTWVASHPGMESMPRELLLRMHGLKQYAEEVAAGADWLDTYADEPLQD